MGHGAGSAQGTAAEGRAGRRIDPSPRVWRATRSCHWLWVTSSLSGRIGSQARAERSDRAAEVAQSNGFSNVFFWPTAALSRGTANGSFES